MAPQQTSMAATFLWDPVAWYGHEERGSIAKVAITQEDISAHFHVPSQKETYVEVPREVWTSGSRESGRLRVSLDTSRFCRIMISRTRGFQTRIEKTRRHRKRRTNHKHMVKSRVTYTLLFDVLFFLKTHL